MSEPQPFLILGCDSDVLTLAAPPIRNQEHSSAAPASPHGQSIFQCALSKTVAARLGVCSV
eukprot:4257987-Amphidinium_carterae.1